MKEFEILTKIQILIDVYGSLKIGCEEGKLKCRDNCEYHMADHLRGASNVIDFFIDDLKNLKGDIVNNQFYHERPFVNTRETIDKICRGGSK